ncbi:MAG: hypothetical protein HKP15_09895 [Akkermansiaceae bacterium]|nr:hypothetical protein [Akkermansiaceae bacterium]
MGIIISRRNRHATELAARGTAVKDAVILDGASALAFSCGGRNWRWIHQFLHRRAMTDPMIQGIIADLRPSRLYAMINRYER